MARDRLRCLPPTRTLRRIRWPLQPRSRDRPTAFGDVTTAERRSHAILGLARSLTALPRWRSSHQTSFRSTRSLTLSCQTPRRLGPRSHVPPRFLARCVRAYSRPKMLPADFCNCLRRTDEKIRGSRFPRWDDGHDHLPFLTPHARPTRVAPSSGETRRAAHSSV
jgi:hypothetical protein